MAAQYSLRRLFIFPLRPLAVVHTVQAEVQLNPEPVAQPPNLGRNPFKPAL